MLNLLARSQFLQGTKYTSSCTNSVSIKIPTGNAANCAVGSTPTAAPTPAPSSAVCSIITTSPSTVYKWGGTYKNFDGGSSTISAGSSTMYISNAMGADKSNSLVFTESTGGNDYKFTSSSITQSSIFTDPAAQSYSFSGFGQLCGGGSCTGTVPFTVSGNTKQPSPANDFFFCYPGGEDPALIPVPFPHHRILVPLRHERGRRRIGRRMSEFPMSACAGCQPLRMMVP